MKKHKPQLLIPKGIKPKRNKPGRVKDKRHLAHVATKPCCCCGGVSGPPHHLLRGDPKRGMGRRAGDDFTIPLCKGHHDELHNCGLHGLGDEKKFLAHHGVDGVALAKQLWAETRPSVSETGEFDE